MAAAAGPRAVQAGPVWGLLRSRRVCRLRRRFTRDIQQGGSVVRAEPFAGERVHRIRRYAPVSLALLTDEARLLEIRREKREAVGAFAGGLKGGDVIGLEECDGACDFVVTHW